MLFAAITAHTCKPQSRAIFIAPSSREADAGASYINHPRRSFFDTCTLPFHCSSSSLRISRFSRIRFERYDKFFITCESNALATDSPEGVYGGRGVVHLRRTNRCREARSAVLRLTTRSSPFGSLVEQLCRVTIKEQRPQRHKAHQYKTNVDVRIRGLQHGKNLLNPG